MKICFVSRTSYSGGHTRMAECINRYTEHEAVALSPTIWFPSKRWLNPMLQSVGCTWWIGSRKIVDRWLEWADVVHFVYNSSLHDLGRPDLIGKKICVWHLATRWRDKFLKFFPEDSSSRYRFAVSAEGWTAYDMGPYSWKILPVLFPIDTPPFRPLSMKRRARRACMSPRLLVDTDEKGRTISAPRSAAAVDSALSGLPLKIINFIGWRECMMAKAASWVGIDDIVNPLLHLSGFEFLSLEVPCFNSRSGTVEREIGDVSGAPWPFLDAAVGETEDLRLKVKAAIECDLEPWIERCKAARRWMENHYSASRMVGRYLDFYAKG